MNLHRWIEIGALGSLAGIFAIIPVHAPQGVDFFAVAFFLLGSLLIDQRDIDAAGWAGRRPFVFACTALILAIPFGSGVCSVNGFNAQIGSGVYIVSAPCALFLIAAKARFHLVGPEGIKRLILVGIFGGLIPATIFALFTISRPPSEFFLPGQPATNIVAIYISCIIAIVLNLTTDFGRRARILGYVAVLALFVLGWLTASRTFLVSMFVVVALYAFQTRHNKVLRQELLSLAVGGVALLVAAAVTYRSALMRIFYHQPSDFFDGRLQTWADGLELFRRYPVCGIGWSTFYNTSLNPLYLERIHRHIKFKVYYHAHDIYLNVLAEGGVMLGVLLLVLIAAAVYGCYTIFKRDPHSRFGQVAVALVMILLVVGLFESTLVRPVLFPLAIFLGLGLNVTRRELPQAEKPA